MNANWLFSLSKHKVIGVLVGVGFQYFDRLLPVKKVCNSKKTIGFFHPQPSYNGHVIFSPKKAIHHFDDFCKGKNIFYFTDLFQCIYLYNREHNLSGETFFVCCNGGIRQEVQQVHFHYGYHEFKAGFECADMVFDHNEVIYKTHLITVVMHKEDQKEDQKEDRNEKTRENLFIEMNIQKKSVLDENLTSALYEVAAFVQLYIKKHNNRTLGYSLLYQSDLFKEREFYVFHLTCTYN